MEDRLGRAIAAIDEAAGGAPSEGERAYGARMTAALERLAPDAGEALRLAVRAQHLERWKTPRASYPEGRAGYLRWRADLARTHAERLGEILRAVGYDEGIVARAEALVQKKGLGRDAEAQLVEDCACLVFLEHELEAFAEGRDESAVIEILRKTWRKLSERGRAAALELTMPPRARALVERALAK